MNSKPFGSRAKGNGYERQIAKKLSNAWGIKFVRTPNSGAFKRLAPADIIPEDRNEWLKFPFHLELKKRQGWALEQLLTNTCPVLKWYLEEEKKQTEARGNEFNNKCMLLIFSKNFDSDYVMFRTSFGFGSYLEKLLLSEGIHINLKTEYSYIIILLEDLLKIPFTSIMTSYELYSKNNQLITD